MGMTAFDLNENLECLDNIHQGKFNIIYASAEAVMDKRFHNSLKLKKKIRYLTTKSLDWTEKSFRFACKRYFIFTLHGKNNRFFFLWEQMFFLMQTMLIVPAMQHGCREKAL